MEFKGKGPLTFRSVRHRRRALNGSTLSKAYREAGFTGIHVPHGWRSRFSTVMNELATGSAPRGTDDYGEMMVSGGAVLIAGDTSLLLQYGRVATRPAADRLATIEEARVGVFQQPADEGRADADNPARRSEGECTNFEIDGPSGQRIGGLPDDLRGATNSNEVVQLAMEYEDLGSGQHRLKVALNTIVMFEGPTMNAEAGGQPGWRSARDGAGTIADGGFLSRPARSNFDRQDDRG